MTLLTEKTRRAQPRKAPENSPQGAMLLRVLAVLENAAIPCIILHGHDYFPQEVHGDVDCMIPALFLPKELARVLHANRAEIGAEVVQWFSDGAHLIVLAGKDTDGKPVLLQLHVSSQFEMAGRVFFRADEILEGRRSRDGFWIPAAGVEFACILINKLTKRALNVDSIRRMSSLFMVDPFGCESQAFRLLPPQDAKLVCDSARGGDWQFVQDNIHLLRHDLLKSPVARPAGHRISRLFGKLRRWIRPGNGYHAVFLGPDGVGKSTVIETFRRDLSPVFLHSIYLTFAPGLIPGKFAAPKPGGPHSLPPRSFPASLLKAAWWLVCYTLGYFVSIRPTLARGGLVVNHRYLVDAIVDQKRYRYSGPVGLLSAIWAISPKPDIVFLLDADPLLIQKRKQEVTLAETTRQVQAYRKVIGTLPTGRIIDASQTPERVAAQVEWVVLHELADRVRRRFALEKH